MNNSTAFALGKHILSYLIYYNITIDSPLAFKNDLFVSFLFRSLSLPPSYLTCST